MSRTAHLPLLACLVLGISGALGACQALAGIKDRTYDPMDAAAAPDGEAGASSADVDAGPSARYVIHCAQAKPVCNDALYSSYLGICALRSASVLRDRRSRIGSALNVTAG